MNAAQNPVQASVTPEPILQLAMSFMASKHLFVANAIGLFEHLADGPTTLDEVAGRSGVPRRTVRIIADAMVALGLVDRQADRYQNTPVAAAYLSGRTPTDLRPLLRFWDRLSYAAWQQFEEAVRSGQSPTRHGHFSEEDQRIFSDGVEALTAGPAHAFASTYDFSQHRRLLDVGGGTGSFLLAVVQRYPEVQATLFELPTVAPVARQRLEREPLQRPIAVVAGDFFTDPLPTGQDAIILANVVHLFSPERNRALLRRLRQAVAPGARLLLVDLWTDPTHTQPLPAALLAGEFLVIAGEGDVYSQDELTEWLVEAGWRYLEHRALTGPASLVVAEAE
jgi:SAM-dependent methyltransferase